MASVASPRDSARQGAPALQTMPANSSFIALFEYDQANLTLTTHLKDGAIYQHKMVMPLEWDQLKQAHNHGSHWTRALKGKKASVRIKSAKSPKGDLRHPRRHP